MIRACPSCGVKNRIPPEHLADTGRCGACKNPLPPLSEPLDVNAHDFEEITRKARVPVLVDFWAAWCGPCRMAAPEVKKAATHMAGRALVLKVNTEENPQLAQKYNVTGIPNFMVMQGGRVVFQQAGLVNHRQMEQWLQHSGA